MRKTELAAVLVAREARSSGALARTKAVIRPDLFRTGPFQMRTLSRGLRRLPIGHSRPPTSPERAPEVEWKVAPPRARASRILSPQSPNTQQVGDALCHASA